ncbi:MAG TPA: ABC transporter substrate-binding protein, partial [Micromonosporaceae bacterium]|nr:ABC transporter substrate-binding protein [Micromonosporaceae bacterium]
MRLTRATAVTALAVAILATSLAGCDLPTESEGADDITIGADLELTGAGAAIGKAYHDALRLRVEQLNEAGVAGNRRINLVVRDNRSDSNLSLRNIGGFGDDRSVAAVITGGCSACVMAASRTINDKRLPTISLAPSTRVTEPVA